MKILLCHRPGGAFGYISDGWASALMDKGHEVRRWDGIEKSWRDFRPDLYIGCSGHKQPIPKSDAKIVIHVNPKGPVTIPGIMEEEQTVTWVMNQNPDAVFGYGHEGDRIVWSGWEDSGIKWVPMPTAADRIFFSSIVEYEDKPNDIVYLGGRWPYKAKTIDTYLLPLLSREDVVSKTHGWGDWPDGVCEGVLATDRANAFLNSGKVGPCISEQHTQMYGIDIPERAFKLAICGALIVHDSVPNLKNLIPSAVVSSSPEDFVDKCVHWSKDVSDRERIELAQQQRSEVLADHTYHHRMSTLLRAVGFDAEAELMVA